MMYWKIGVVQVMFGLCFVGVQAEAYFSIGSGFDSTVIGIVVQEDDKILMGGGFTSFNGSTTDPNYFNRFNTDGSLDTSFSANLGTGFNSGGVNAIAVQEDDKILMGGGFTSFNGSTTDPDRLIRLNADGTLDTAFSANLGSGFVNSEIFSVTLQPDDKIIVAGAYTVFNGSSTDPDYLTRLNADGTLDTAFSANLGTGFDATVRSAKLQSDDKIVIAGQFNSFNGSTTDPNKLIRLNTDGTLDTAFSANLGTGFNGDIRTLAIQADDKILLGGVFTSFNGSTTDPDRLIRLNADGTLDTAFSANLGTGFDGTVSAVIEQTDNNKILMGGGFTSFNSSSTDPNYLIRLNADGTLDTAFSANLGTGFDAQVFGVRQQTDGKVLVGGGFTTLNGIATNTPDKFVRLNSDGTLDPDAPPAITILGDNPTSLTAGSSYSDAGATATDISDGTVTADIVTTNGVNASVAGSYTVVYNVTDNNDNTSSATRTVTVSAAASGGGGNSSGGGGGGGGSSCKKATAKASVLKSLAEALITTPELKIKDVKPPVKTLQQFLNGVGCVIAKSGPTSPLSETEEFTVKTKNALRKFQKANSIKPADGVLNNETKKYLEKTYVLGTGSTINNTVLIQKLLAQVALLQAELAKLKGIPPPKTTSPLLTYAHILSTSPDMVLDTKHASVKTLQQFLNTLGYTIATNDFGAPGRETTTFWYSTQNALKRFQRDNNIEQTGLFDQATREGIRVKYVK